MFDPFGPPYIRDIIGKYQNGMPKVARKALNIKEVWSSVCCHDCRAHLVESYCKESNISDKN